MLFFTHNRPLQENEEDQLVQSIRATFAPPPPSPNVISPQDKARLSAARSQKHKKITR